MSYDPSYPQNPPNCGCNCTHDASNSDDYSTSPWPIRYSSGEIQLTVSDLSSEGFGQPWGHTRSYGNRTFEGSPATNGNGWFVNEMPFILKDADGSAGTIGIVSKTKWFAHTTGPDFTGMWKPKFSINGGLNQADPTADFVQVDSDGAKIKYWGNDNSHPLLQNRFKSSIDPAGHETYAVYDTYGRQTSFTRTDGSSSAGFTYTYYGSGSVNDQLQTVTYSVNGVNVRRCNYAYYGASDSNGMPGDLKTAMVQQYDTTTNSWTTLTTSYYRYYVLGASNGFPSGLKFVIGPAAFARMMSQTTPINPLTASDAALAQYADYYFEYDSYDRVTLETVDGGSLTSTFTYSTFGAYDDYNAWQSKTVETHPDGTENIIYMNYAGQVMLKVVKSGTDEWYTYFKYDDAGKGLLRAESSAVASYSESSPGLVTLHGFAGLIHTFEYYDETPGAGGAPFQLKTEGVQKGILGTITKIRSLEYVSQTVGDDTIYYLASETKYQSSDSGGSQPAVTSYSYLWFTSTFQVSQVTETLPTISTTQNGSGTANTNVQIFDSYGRPIWYKDENGSILYTEFDLATGALKKRIEDLNTTMESAPDGWISTAGLNSIYDYEFDLLGRMTQELGPSHQIDRNGAPITIRTAKWIVSHDVTNQRWIANGYAEGPATSYDYMLVNPVTIKQFDKDQRVTDIIQAVRATNASSSEEIESGKLLSTDLFPQTTWVRWTRSNFDDQGNLASSRIYHTIPVTGSGSSGVNFDETAYGYDVLDRKNRTKTPGGTITRAVYNPMGWLTQSWVGTNDNGATDADPTGAHATGNNMVKVKSVEYDYSTAGGDGNVTKLSLFQDASVTRNTTFSYDYRDRRVSVTAAMDYSESYTYDNQGRMTGTNRYSAASSLLVSSSQRKFDLLGRVFQEAVYAVGPDGVPGYPLTTNYWYDPAGNVVKQSKAGSSAFQRFAYDNLQRLKVVYSAYNTSATGYPHPFSPSGDTVIEQTEYEYDEASNLKSKISRARFDNATGTGLLNGPTGAQPQARVSYTAYWPDPLGRLAAAADYGTNPGTTWTRPSTAPARSANVHVRTQAYNSRGELEEFLDEQGTINQSTFDDAGRLVGTKENYGASNNRESLYSYNPDGRLATSTAVNGTTTNQVTTYIYGTTLSDSDVASNDLLRQKIYPDDVSTAFDRDTFAYNRLGQMKQFTAPNGTVHSYLYDVLGRVQHDCVSTLGTGVNGAVRRISQSFEPRGMVSGIGSYDNPTVGSGAVLNEVLLEYNAFGQLSKDRQSNSGYAGTHSPTVTYYYATGANNTIRPTGLQYPDGRHISYNYGATGGMNDLLSRIDNIVEGAITVASYTYLGLDTIVESSHAEPSLRNTYIQQAGDSAGDAGDRYVGLDRFDRIVDARWMKGTANVDRFQSCYTAASNRLWRANRVATSSQDEFYSYDGLYRLNALQRGSLNTTNTGISGTSTWEEDFTYDPTGNWANYTTKAGGSTTLNQTRTSTVANAIQQIGGSSSLIGYDRSGNMTKTPVPTNWTAAYTLTYDAWNRLVTVALGATTIASYSYDGLTRRLTTTTASEKLEYYYSASWQLLEERDGTDGPSASSSSEQALKHFVWGLRGIDDLILRDSYGDETPRIYALRDAMHVTAISDAEGTILERYSYNAFGSSNVMSPAFSPRSSSNFDWELRYCSYLFDIDTGFYIVRNRFLQPNLGRWLTRDPIGEIAGLNLYAYCSNNPTKFIDPTGLLSIWKSASNVGRGGYYLYNAYQYDQNALNIKKQAEIIGQTRNTDINDINEGGLATQNPYGTNTNGNWNSIGKSVDKIGVMTPGTTSWGVNFAVPGISQLFHHQLVKNLFPDNGTIVETGGGDLGNGPSQPYHPHRHKPDGPDQHDPNNSDDPNDPFNQRDPLDPGDPNNPDNPENRDGNCPKNPLSRNAYDYRRIRHNSPRAHSYSKYHGTPVKGYTYS